MPTINRLSVQNKPITLRKSTGILPVFNTLNFPVSQSIKHPVSKTLEKPKMTGSINL
jgi:hypothetical protein